MRIAVKSELSVGMHVHVVDGLDVGHPRLDFLQSLQDELGFTFAVLLFHRLPHMTFPRRLRKHELLFSEPSGFGLVGFFLRTLLPARFGFGDDDFLGESQDVLCLLIHRLLVDGHFHCRCQDVVLLDFGLFEVVVLEGGLTRFRNE